MERPDIEELLCEKCLVHMTLIDVTPVGKRGIIEHYECPTCGEDYAIVKKLDKLDWIDHESTE